jgi:hypothetical protein
MDINQDLKDAFNEVVQAMTLFERAYILMVP